MWLCVVEEVLHESEQEDGEREENKYPGNEPHLELGLGILTIQTVNEQGQHDKEDQEIKYYHKRFTPRSPMIPARPTNTHTVAETRSKALSDIHLIKHEPTLQPHNKESQWLVGEEMEIE